MKKVLGVALMAAVLIVLAETTPCYAAASAAPSSPNFCDNDKCNFTSSLELQLANSYVTNTAARVLEDTWVHTVKLDIALLQVSRVPHKMKLSAHIRLMNVSGDVCDEGDCWMHVYFTTPYPLVNYVLSGDLIYDGYMVTLRPLFTFTYPPYADATVAWTLSLDTCISTPPTESYCLNEATRRGGHGLRMRIDSNKQPRS